LRLCRSPCGKPLAFRQQPQDFEAAPPRQSRQTLSELIGKAEPFRKESGKAADREKGISNAGVGVSCSDEQKLCQKSKKLTTCYTEIHRDIQIQLSAFLASY
jgi:hypothetical protein